MNIAAPKLSPELASACEFHHPAILDLARWFSSDHLAPALKSTAKMFEELAVDLLEQNDSSAELTVALRKLLESKDAAVRATILSLDGGE